MFVYQSAYLQILPKMTKIALLLNSSLPLSSLYCNWALFIAIELSSLPLSSLHCNWALFFVNDLSSLLFFGLSPLSSLKCKWAIFIAAPFLLQSDTTPLHHLDSHSRVFLPFPDKSLESGGNWTFLSLPLKLIIFSFTDNIIDFLKMKSGSQDWI